MIRYTLGFLFNKDLSRILLIHKLSPDWQKGKVNGLGGKYEKDETCFECISREVIEETGLIVSPNEWKKVGELHSSKWVVDVMTSVYKNDEGNAKSIEKERIEWLNTSDLPINIMSNLSWLIPLCKDYLQNKEIDTAIVSHTF